MLTWLLFIAPLLFGFESKSIFAAIHGGYQDEEQGIRQSLPTLFSSYAVYVAHTVVIGFTLGWIIHTFALALMVMKYASAVLLCGLAYLIWSRRKGLDTSYARPLKEEFMLRVRQPVYPLIVTIMYSLLINVTWPLGLQVVVMSLYLVALAFFTHVFWIVAFQFLGGRFYSSRTLMIMDRVLAGIFVLLAVLVVLP